MKWILMYRRRFIASSHCLMWSYTNFSSRSSFHWNPFLFDQLLKDTNQITLTFNISTIFWKNTFFFTRRVFSFQKKKKRKTMNLIFIQNRPECGTHAYTHTTTNATQWWHQADIYLFIFFTKRWLSFAEKQLKCFDFMAF